jgi:hypothetical protein
VIQSSFCKSLFLRTLKYCVSAGLKPGDFLSFFH